MMYTKEEMQKIKEEEEIRQTIYPYEFVLTWKDEGGTVTDDQQQEIGNWLIENIGPFGAGWIDLSDGIGYATTLCIHEKDEAMAFRLAWGHLVYSEKFLK